LEAACFAEGGIGIEGELYLINQEALAAQTQVISNAEVVKDVTDYAKSESSAAYQAKLYVANQAKEQETLIKGSVPPEAITPVSEARVALQAEIEVVPSAGKRFLYGAAEVGVGLAKFAGQALTVYGAHNMAARNADEFGGSFGVYAGTFTWGVLAGAVDDALAAATIEMGSAPVLDSWERNGAGPTQVATANALRSYYQWAAKSGW
jgi:hypothetical protein